MDANAHRSRIVLPAVYRGLWCQAASTNSPRTWPLPVLVIGPWLRDPPEEYSDGTKPMNAPIVCR